MQAALYLRGMRLADLVAPVPFDRFETEVFGRRPLHIPATAGTAKAPIDWPGMNALLGIASHWTEANIKLVMNSRPVQPDFYMNAVETLGGVERRADPAKVNVFLGMGASLIANSLEEISPDVRAIAGALADHYQARVGANAYCSFAGIQAFASHCDLHEVFAIQCEGEKVWRIYENRANLPTEALIGDDAQRVIDSVKGRVLMQARMRPGDLLYIPRGYYHDALASGEASLHVSFAVAPFTGRILFRMLEELATEDAAFREYLPDARLEGGKTLAQRLELLAARVSNILRSRRLAAELGFRQRGLANPFPGFQLPMRQKLEFFARTKQPAELRRDRDTMILDSAGRQTSIGHLGEPTEWALGRSGFSLQQLFASFQWLDQDELRALVDRLEGLGLLVAYEPAIQ